MRKGIITASNIKKLISSKDLNNTADTMIANRNKQNTAIIPAIQYGIVSLFHFSTGKCPEPTQHCTQLSLLMKNFSALSGKIIQGPHVEETKHDIYPDNIRINFETPLSKMITFKKSHSCDLNCNCSQVFIKMLTYTKSEIDEIEKATKGQHRNPLWHTMRQNVLSSSKFKNIIHSVNIKNTARILLEGSKLHENRRLPIQIRYGRENEKNALDLFLCLFGIKDCYPPLATRENCQARQRMEITN